MTPLKALLDLVDTPRDSALLRFLVADEYLKVGDTSNALRHLRVSVEKQPCEPVAWKILGDVQALAHETEKALESYRRGFALAIETGDERTARELQWSATPVRVRSRSSGRRASR